jgi:superfamily II DNA or RNA helicase
MSKKCKITVTDEVWCNISGLLPSEHDALYNAFGVYVDGYFFMPSYKLGRFDGKIRYYHRTGKTYVRLLDRILPYLEKWDYDIELVDNRKYWEHPEVTGKITKIDSSGIAVAGENLDVMGDVETRPGKKFELRPYQLQCVQKCIEAGSGFIIAGTGAGKTSITAAISYFYGRKGYKIITIVPSGDLVTQTKEWYETLQLDVGEYSGDNKDIDHTHVVATWQAIQYNPSIMQDFQVLIWDESHGIKAAVAQKLINESGKHIAFRFGVTGTFPKPEADRLSLVSSIGPILLEIPAAWLIEHGYLAKVQIQPVELNETYVDEEFPDYASEKAFLSKSTARMEMIANLIISQCATNGNTLVLVNSISFGEKLASLIKGAVFLYGESPKDIRKEHYDMFEQNDDIIVIASSGIASTGISIDRVFCLMLVDAGKSFIKAIQSIGRGLRLGHDKDAVHVVDVYSKQKWAKKHYKERLGHYKNASYPVLPTEKLRVKDKI